MLPTRTVCWSSLVVNWHASSTLGSVQVSFLCLIQNSISGVFVRSAYIRSWFKNGVGRTQHLFSTLLIHLSSMLVQQHTHQRHTVRLPYCYGNPDEGRLAWKNTSHMLKLFVIFFLSKRSLSDIWSCFCRHQGKCMEGNGDINTCLQKQTQLIKYWVFQGRENHELPPHIEPIQRIEHMTHHASQPSRALPSLRYVWSTWIKTTCTDIKLLIYICLKRSTSKSCTWYSEISPWPG